MSWPGRNLSLSPPVKHVRMINASYFERCRGENERESATGMDMWPHKYTIRVSLTDTRPPATEKPYPIENILLVVKR